MKVTGKRNIFWKRPSGAPYKPDELPDDFLNNSNFLLTDGLLQKWDIQRVVKFASAFAALKCTKLGGRAGIPTLDRVNRLLKESI